MKSKEETIELLNKLSENTLMETLKITYTDVGKDYLTATMPVNSRVHQPMGLLHGGASVALAESVGSAASLLFIDAKNVQVRGIEISANHVKSKKDGIVTAKATLKHKGNTTHLWEITIVDESDNLVSLCKLTTIVLRKKP